MTFPSLKNRVGFRSCFVRIFWTTFGFQNPPKTSLGSLWVPPRRLKTLPRQAKIHPNRFQDAHKRSQMLPRCLQDAPKPSKMPPRNLQDTRKPPRCPLETSKMHQNDPRPAQAVPRFFGRRLQNASQDLNYAMESPMRDARLPSKCS